MSFNSRRAPKRIVLIGLTFVTLLVLGYGLCSFWTLSKLNGEVDAWITENVSKGWSISHGEVQTGLAFDHVILKFPNPKISAPFGEWKGEYLSISCYLFDPGHLKFVVIGPNQIAIGRSEWSMSAYPLRVDLHVSGNTGNIKSLHATASDVQITSENKAAFFSQGLGLALTSFNSTSDIAQPSVEFIGTAAGVDFKSSPTVSMQPITVLELSGKFMGALPPSPPVQSLSKWSADGGTIEVEHFVLEWSPIKIEGGGTIAFDHLLQPIAAFSTHMQGLPHLTETLQQTGTLSIQDAEALRVSYHGQANPPLPITFQDGKVWLGTVAIAEQPLIHWPE